MSIADAGSHRNCQHLLPLAEHQVRHDPRRSALVAFYYQREQHFRLLRSLWQVTEIADHRRSKLSSYLGILGSSRSLVTASISCTSRHAEMNGPDLLDSTSLWPMAHMACVFPVPGIPNASTWRQPRVEGALDVVMTMATRDNGEGEVGASRGEKLSNTTHRSTTEPEARLMRTGKRMGGRWRSWRAR